MTTDLWSDSSTHTDNATFRALGLKVSNSFTTVGFPKSADTGQIDWATVTRPAEYSAAGYEIRYFNDSLHATYPIYVKLEYGRSNYSAASTLVLWVTVGTGTNGAGTITGVKISQTLVVPGGGASGSLFPWYFCCKPGYIAVKAAHLAVDRQWFFSVCRTCDDSGEINGEGVMFYYTQYTELNRIVNCGSQISDSRSYAMFPGSATSTAVGANKQAARHFAFQPTIRCVPFFLSYFDAEIGAESAFTAVTAGVAERAFLTLGGTSATPTHCSLNNIATHRLAMQYD
jgi:hypothetical protein